MLSSDISPAEACEIFARDNTGSLAKISEAMGQTMQFGTGFAQAAEKAGCFPGYALGVLRASQYAGRLEEALRSLAQRLNRDAQQEIDGLTGWVEPGLLGFLALAVGLTLLSIMLPLLGVLGAV